jgi:nicotinamidase-related amidase
MPGLDVQPSDFIVDSKRTFDSFLGTPLEMLLRAMNRNTLLVAGCNTNTCVLSTTYGGYNRGFRMVIVAECVASAYGNDLHEFALANIQRRLGWVLTLDEVVAKLAGKRAAATGT